MPALDYNTAIVLGGTMMLGLASGIIGTLALLRRRALLGDALSHATLPGICIAFLVFGRSFGGLLAGALVTGILGVALVALLSRHTRLKEDTNIGIVLSVFFGAGIALSSHIQATAADGAQAGINSFILGKTAGMVRSDLVLIALAGLGVVAAVILLYKELKLLCFDPDFAAVEGWPVLRLDFLLMLLLAVTVVIGLPAVGVALMVALLILPAAAARFWVEGLAPMLGLAGTFGLATGAAGTFASAAAEALPAGPVIVLAGTAIFTLSMLFAPRRGLIARLLQRRSLRERRMLQALLRALYERNEESLPRCVPASTAELAHKRAFGEREARRLLRSLRVAGWVAEEGGGWVLTPSGASHAAEVTRVHRLWEHYLRSSADIDRDLVDPDIEVIESVLPAREVERLEAELRAAGRLPTPVRP